MRALHLSFVLSVAMCMAACASPAPPPVSVAAKPSSSPPLPRSSIAAVVLRRAELGLTDAQVGEMEQIDRKREEEDVAARDELEKERKQAASGRPAGPGPGAGAAAPQGMRGGGMGGGGMRGGGMRGGRMGGGIPAGSSGVKKTDRQATLEDRLDDNDTKAYLDAESVLTESQKGRARDIASDYREQLYEQRELASRKGTSSK